mgnify:CR=1 FL=1
MKIWGDIPKVPGIYNQNKKTGKIQKANEIYGSKDVVSISDRAKDLQTVNKALKNVPDVREERVREIAQKYNTGKYQVSSKEIADKILKSVFDKKV